MNRLVIIGNGFDLAHGLPTSYRNFIDDFWKNFKDKCKTELYKELVYTNDSYEKYYIEYKIIKNFDDFKSNLMEYCNDYNYSFHDINVVASTNFIDIFYFKNKFFKDIIIMNSKNWVDIENEYYRLLKVIVHLDSLTKDQKKEEAIKLNREFEQVKDLLEKYLKDRVEDKYDFNLNNNSILDIINSLKINLNEFLFEDQENLINENKFDLSNYESIVKSSKKYIKKATTHFLNFNYTKTIHTYIDTLTKKSNFESQLNFIHGILDNNTDNKINFGFGDEMDDYYKDIENLDDNEYLRNFKSFQYLQNSNYQNLLNFVESEKFQVYIMGHSCGLSDRTLLNTIFENKNCISIKVFYYENERFDNYTEIVQNISRHFNDKKLMRSKIVNKTFCKPLPQIQLPLK